MGNSPSLDSQLFWYLQAYSENTQKKLIYCPKVLSRFVRLVHSFSFCIRFSDCQEAVPFSQCIYNSFFFWIGGTNHNSDRSVLCRSPQRLLAETLGNRAVPELSSQSCWKLIDCTCAESHFFFSPFQAERTILWGNDTQFVIHPGQITSWTHSYAKPDN